MAGTVTFERGPGGQPVQKLALAWTSDASGAVSGTRTPPLCGALVRVEFVPGANVAQPSDLYGVTLLDEQGLDVLAGQGAGLSNTTATAVIPGVPLNDGTTVGVGLCQIDDSLELVVSGAGDSKGGRVVLYIR